MPYPTHCSNSIQMCYLALLTALLTALLMGFPVLSLAQNDLREPRLAVKKICPAQQAIFRFEQGPYYLLLNTGPSECFNGSVRSFFDKEELFRVKGEKIGSDLIRLTFVGKSAFTVSY